MAASFKPYLKDTMLSSSFLGLDEEVDEEGD